MYVTWHHIYCIKWKLGRNLADSMQSSQIIWKVAVSILLFLSLHVSLLWLNLRYRTSLKAWPVSLLTRWLLIVGTVGLLCDTDGSPPNPLKCLQFIVIRHYSNKKSIISIYYRGKSKYTYILLLTAFIH